MKDPNHTIGQVTLPLSKWCSHYRQKPVDVLPRYAKRDTMEPHEVIFGSAKKRPNKTRYLQVGNVRMTAGRWARLTCQSQTALAKKIERGVATVEAIFGPEHAPAPVHYPETD